LGSFLKKLRIFVIPSGIFNIMENLISKTRMLLETGWVIQIRHKWPRGGFDRLARCLGITFGKNEWSPIICEGDYKALDVTIRELLTNLYFSMSLIHERKGTPDYALKEKILKWVIEIQAVRIERLFADIFASHEGGVPSGMLNTSHCDSWVTALLFFSLQHGRFLMLLLSTKFDLKKFLLCCCFLSAMVMIYYIT